ncbi:MAG: ATP synthase F1 subunit epsilon [Bacteriovoracaceae bacterium]|jgi:F-type H+-transporting ATPase subunit epsilon|nr:ATP synthase F1 subunit epsilon [Bacteriovoracaceae bacterium]
MSNFSLNIFTPAGIVTDGFACEELIIPTESGQINVLKGHTHLVTKLGTGIVNAKLSNGQTRHFTVAGGLCKILGEKINILAKTSETAEQVNQERAKSALSKAQSRLQGPVTSVEVIKFQRKIERAKARLKIANLK